ncbi:MAG: response regulator [Mariprofundus sp.]|nr:response regulator [Mariprofundus sp.]
MRELAQIHVHDEEAWLNLRQRLPALGRALGLPAVVADRMAILGCDLAGTGHQLSLRLDKHHSISYFVLCAPQQPEKQGQLTQLCDQSETDAYGYQHYMWRLASAPELNWPAWREKLEAPSKTELTHNLEQRALDLDKKNRALEESTRLKSEFLANMSHELRTPMNSIIGFTGRVLKKASDKLDARQLKNLQTVERNAHHLLGLINDLLDISKVEAGRMELFPEHLALSELMNEVRELTNSLWQDKGLEFTMELADDALSLYVDRVRLKQILINLVSNAVKFTEAGAVVMRASLNDAKDGSEPTVSIAVQDSGIGMRQDDLQFIFEAFRQADGSNTRAYGGTGLGLNITKNFIELMGGHIEVSSVYGEGSVFTVCLPQQQSVEGERPADIIEPQTPSLSDISKGKAVILCIDDNADVLELFQQCLRDDGYQVICANNGDDGLKIAKEQQPAAITLDVQMPHKDGWSVLQALKADPNTKNIPVLMATMMDNKALGMKLGAIEYLEKPIVPEKLLQSIKYARLLGETREVLVVDDDAGVRELMQQVFEDAHIQVRLAVDGVDGMAKMRAKAPDLIILDLMMPNMDGFEVIQSMQNDDRLKRIPLIVSTAKTLSSDEINWLESHASQVMIKGGMELNTMVTQAINELKL